MIAGCDCSVCVTAESHNSGTLTIQRAIDEVRVSGGTVCLGPGLYQLGQSPVTVSGAGAVRVRGHGWRTALLYAGDGPAIIVEGSIGVVLEDFAVAVPPVVVLGDRQIGGGPAIALRNDFSVTVQRCQLMQIGDRQRGNAAITLGGYLFDARIRENMLVAASGVAGPAGVVEGRIASLLTVDLAIEDNLLLCPRRGISFARASLHLADTRVARNIVSGCAQGGIVAVGAVMGASRLDIEGNEVIVLGDGIVVGTDGARVSDNDVSALPQASTGDGIALVDGLDPTGIDRAQVLSNRVVGLPGHGIAVRAQLRSAMIKQNVVQAVGGAGIFMESGAAPRVSPSRTTRSSRWAPWPPTAGAAATSQGSGSCTLGGATSRATWSLAWRARPPSPAAVWPSRPSPAPRCASPGTRSWTWAPPANSPETPRAWRSCCRPVAPTWWTMPSAAARRRPATRTRRAGTAFACARWRARCSRWRPMSPWRRGARQCSASSAPGSACSPPRPSTPWARAGTSWSPTEVSRRWRSPPAGPSCSATIGSCTSCPSRSQSPSCARPASYATSNFIAGPNDNDALILIVSPKAFTALGNNTPQKNIRVGTDPANVAPLGAPWDALNVK